MSRIIWLVSLLIVVVASSTCDKRPPAATVLQPSDWEVVGCGNIIWNGKAVDGKTKTECYFNQYWRPATPLSECPNGDRSGLLCYPPCREGYTGIAFVCWQQCPAGYTDDGAFCRKDAHIISSNNDACPWYNKCGLGTSCSICPEGYSNDGCTCRRNADIFAKDTYTRGAGKPMTCGAGKQQIAALCYGNCDEGYHAEGIYCVADKQTCREVPVTEPPNYATVKQYCFKAINTWECRTHSVYADTEEHGKEAVQRCDLNAQVEKIDCQEMNTACSQR